MKKSRALIMLALLLAIISTYFVYRYIETLRTVPAVQAEYQNVVIAVTDIPQHIKITEAMLEVKSIPKEAVLTNAAKLITDLVGYTTTMTILQGEQISVAKVSSSEKETGLSYRIPENMRAIVVPTSEVSGLAGYLTKGDRIDLLVTYTDRPGPGTPPPTTTPVATQPIDTTPGATTPVGTLPPVTIPPTTGASGEPIEGYIETITQFQNVEVLELGIKPTIGEDGKISQNVGVPSSVTLLVTPQQAEVISYMLNNATFQMALRNPVDGLNIPLDHFGTDNFNDWRNR